MEHEIAVEGFYLQVEVTVLADDPPCPGSNSDWDAQGERELEFKLLSAFCYDDDGIRMSAQPYWSLAAITKQFGPQIELALWYEIDARKRRQRWAA